MAVMPLDKMPLPMEFQPDPVVIHADPTVVRVRHRANISKKFSRYLFCLGCANNGCQHADEALQRTYFEVHENRIEFNYPIPTFCCIYDAIDVIHFDRDIIQNVGKAECCSPMWTHMSICPTCFDLCGEGVVISSNQCACFKPSVLSSFFGPRALFSQFMDFILWIRERWYCG